MEPWEILTVDLCGPWKAMVEFWNQKKKEYRIWVLTLMDEATGWVEIYPIADKELQAIALATDTEWFCRYPRPKKCIHDNGMEFIGEEFQEMLESYGITSKPTTIKNPQANAMHERAHLLIAEMLRTQRIKVRKRESARIAIRRVLQAVAFALRTAINTITKYSPGQLIFGRDMIIHMKEVANWSLLRERKAIQQTKDNERENKSRSEYKYEVGEKVLIITKRIEREGKVMGFKHKGPYKVLKVYSNGTVKIQYTNFKDIIHIRRLKPYVEKDMENRKET